MEPLSAHEKWTELLGDIGKFYSILDGISPGLGVASMSNHEDHAEIVVGDGIRELRTSVPLNDGVLVVGINDDIVTAFGDSKESNG